MARPVRQWAATLDRVAPDHLERYRFAARVLAGAKRARVLDAGCGCGYGSAILAEAGCDVLGIDIDSASIAFARQHYVSTRARFAVRDICEAAPGYFDAVVSIETLEHVSDAPRAVAAFRACAPVLVASVPNELVIPWATYPGRHPDHSSSSNPAATSNAASTPMTERCMMGPLCLPRRSMRTLSANDARIWQFVLKPTNPGRRDVRAHWNQRRF